MLKIIFCDIDGVLNNKTSQTMFASGDDSKYGLDPNNVSNLINIIKNTNSKLVWSTNWRKYPFDFVWGNEKHKYVSPFKKARNLLRKYEFQSLPCCPHKDNTSKFEDVMQWLITIGYEFEINFVVIDDMIEHGLYKFEDRFFLTKPQFGLTKEISNDIIEYLNTHKPTSLFLPLPL